MATDDEATTRKAWRLQNGGWPWQVKVEASLMLKPNVRPKSGLRYPASRAEPSILRRSQSRATTLSLSPWEAMKTSRRFQRMIKRRLKVLKLLHTVGVPIIACSETMILNIFECTPLLDTEKSWKIDISQGPRPSGPKLVRKIKVRDQY